MLRIVEALRRRGCVGQRLRSELAERIVDRDSPGLECVRVPVVVDVEFVDGDLHHLRPAVVVEVEVRLQVSDFAGFGLTESVLERREIRVDRRVEQRIQPIASGFGVIGVGLPEEHPCVEANQASSGDLADDWRLEGLARGEVARVLPEFHTRQFGREPHQGFDAVAGQ